MSLLTILLAQTTPTTTPTTNPSGAGAFFPIALILGLGVFVLMSSRSQKKREARKRDEMHAALSKNDRVLTIGGVIGTVMSVKENEVVLKVDESTNTKMTFLKSSIQKIVTDDQLTVGS